MLVQGLKNASYAKFNGMQGTVVGDNDTGRIVVELPDKRLAMKRENLTLIFNFTSAPPAIVPSSAAEESEILDEYEADDQMHVVTGSKKQRTQQKPVNAAQVAAQQFVSQQRATAATASRAPSRKAWSSAGHSRHTAS